MNIFKSTIRGTKKNRHKAGLSWGFEPDRLIGLLLISHTLLDLVIIDAQELVGSSCHVAFVFRKCGYEVFCGVEKLFRLARLKVVAMSHAEGLVTLCKGFGADLAVAIDCQKEAA